jgi:signal transduction histidine kinase
VSAASVIRAVPSVLGDRTSSVAPTYAAVMRKAAHDIRTPLAAVTQGIDALLNLTDETPEGAQWLFNIVCRNVVLMGDVLAASVDRARSVPLPTSQVDLGELATDVADLIGPVLSARGQIIEVKITGRTTRVVGDYGGLARVLLNLLDNASKYGPFGDQLRVRVRRRNAATIVSVHDHGPGIPPGERHAIFRAFYRTRGARQSEVEGFGLGLSVVREVIEQHRGSFGVSCERGETRVWFSIPTQVTDGERA